MLGFLDNSGQARDLANPDFKHLGQAPVRAARYRIQAQSPAIQALSQSASSPESDESHSHSNARAAPGLRNESVSCMFPKFDNASSSQGNDLDQTHLRVEAAHIAQPNTRRYRLPSDVNIQQAAEQRARKTETIDTEHTDYVNRLLQQLNELSVSKQRITEEFRSSQQLAAQALRRLDEECERRQQLELRIIESEAALNIMGRIFEDRTAELVLVRSKLDIAECRTAELEKRMGLSTTPMNHADSKLHDVTDTPLLPAPLGDDDQRQVCSIFGQMAAAFLDCDCDLCLLQAAHGAEMEDIVHKQKNLLLEIQMICKAH
jgi:hypothetical protein